MVMDRWVVVDWADEREFSVADEGRDLTLVQCHKRKWSNYPHGHGHTDAQPPACLIASSSSLPAMAVESTMNRTDDGKDSQQAQGCIMRCEIKRELPMRRDNKYKCNAVRFSRWSKVVE